MNPYNTLDPNMERALDTLSKPPRGKMSLRQFQTKYLPFLNNQPMSKEKVEAMLRNMEAKTGEKHTVNDLHGNLISEWINDVGHGLHEVDIYNDEGEVVYVVPPIIDTGAEVFADTASIPNLVIQASNHARIHPVMAVTFIQNNIQPLVLPPKLNVRQIEMWNKIYAYHDLPLIKIDREGDSVAPMERDDNSQKFNSAGDPIVSNIDEFDD